MRAQTSLSRFPSIPATLLLLLFCFPGPAALFSQDTVSFRLSGSVEVATQPGHLYQVLQSGDMQQWEPLGNWIWGDGQTHVLAAPLAGEALYARIESHPVADISAALETRRSQLGLPALAVAVFQQGRLTVAGAVGQRRHNTEAPVTIKDRWHHGSMTKSMTASLAALMVEQGQITWETTLGSVFPDKAPAMASGWSGVTLRQLLSNAAGAPGDLNASGIWTQLWNFNGLPEDGRLLLLDRVTQQPLRFTPGNGYEYSNAGFALAGAMLEQVAGKPWERLMEELFFPAFGMQEAGFGVPATPRHLDHPVGHSGIVSNPVIWDPGTSADNPPAIGPAATVHAPLFDIARYAQTHLRGARGEAGIPLSPATFDTLHSRQFGNDYAFGWNVLNRPWAGGDAIHHTGSNTQWFTNIWIAPEVNWACVICTNFGGTDSFTKVDNVVLWLIQNYGP